MLLQICKAYLSSFSLKKSLKRRFRKLERPMGVWAKPHEHVKEQICNTFVYQVGGASTHRWRYGHLASLSTTRLPCSSRPVVHGYSGWADHGGSFCNPLIDAPPLNFSSSAGTRRTAATQPAHHASCAQLARYRLYDNAWRKDMFLTGAGHVPQPLLVPNTLFIWFVF